MSHESTSGRLSSSLPFYTAASPRPTRIALVNIMDNAKGTEEHFLSLICNADPNAEVTLCRMACAKADKDLATPKYFRDPAHPLHLLSDDYVDWHDVIGEEDFDLVIVTGINRGKLTYTELEEEYPLFWHETQDLLDAIEATTASGRTGHAMLICWSAFAAMKHWSDVDKGIYDQKLYGLFEHTPKIPRHPLIKGLESFDTLRIPHSRFSYMDENELSLAIKHDKGNVILDGPGGPALWTLHNHAISCVINHPEYGHSTLENEHRRDTARLREETGNPDAVFPAPANYACGSPDTARAFADLKASICPALYRNVIELAKTRKSGLARDPEYTAEVAVPSTMPVGAHQFPA